MLRGEAEGQRARLWWGTNAYGPKCFVSTAVWILFLLVCGEETRGFFLVSARFLASPVSSCCVALRMVSRHGRGVSSVAHNLPQFFLHVVQSALGGPLVNSFRFYGLLHRRRSKRVKRKERSYHLD